MLMRSSASVSAVCQAACCAFCDLSSCASRQCRLRGVIGAMAPKGFLFELTEEEIKDNSRIVAFAERLPSFKRVGEEFADDEAKMRREALQRTLSLNWRYPEIALQCASWCDNRVKSLRNKVDESMFKKAPLDLKCVDTAWMASCIVSLSSVSAGALEQFLVQDPQTVGQILEYGLVVSQSLRLPKMCQQKELLASALRRRCEEVGDRLSKFGQGSGLKDSASGALNWKKFGVYELQFDKEVCKAIIHRPTGRSAKPPSHTIITKAFVLEENWNDFSCRVVLDPCTYHLHKFFPDGEGPHSINALSGDNKDWREMVEGLWRSREEDSQRRKTKVVVPSKPIGSVAKETKKKAAMVKARAALLKQKQDIKNRRKITFG